MIVKAVSLHNNIGTSDKVYYLQLVSVENGKYLVQFEYGRRGKTLKFGTKTENPVSKYEAEDIFDEFVRQKKEKKHYHEIPNPEDLLMIISFSA
jgi:Asp-tRNA(Asn)/Glu-tRNA(Gln) amidotransferase B subunit